MEILLFKVQEHFDNFGVLQLPGTIGEEKSTIWRENEKQSGFNSQTS